MQKFGGCEHSARIVPHGGRTESLAAIAPAGYVVTNQHVTNNGTKFKCALSDQREISANLVGEDPLRSSTGQGLR